MEPKDIFSRAWGILVEHAGARNTDFNRERFIEAFLSPKHQVVEYRFQGHLGFGGKFWRNDRHFYVSCYREEETPTRLAIIEHVNTLLSELPYYEPV